jgi:hypothetical protein
MSADAAQRRSALRAQLFTPRWQDGAVFYIPKPGMEQLVADTWKEHGVCPRCHRWSISDGRCCCGWKSAEYEERVALIAKTWAKHARDIADQIADDEHYLAALHARRR